MKSNLMDQNKIKILTLKRLFWKLIKFGGPKWKISNLNDQNENNLKPLLLWASCVFKIIINYGYGISYLYEK